MKDRERLAWTVLLISFGIFLSGLIVVPFGVYQWIQRATLDPSMVLQSLEGAAQVEQPDGTLRLHSSQNDPIEIVPGVTIHNGADSEALLTVSSPDGTYLLATLQIYPNTDLEISLAKSPRYQSSSSEHHIEVTVTTGRVRMGLATETDRLVDVRSHTPHAQILYWKPGSYALDVVNEQTQITALEGSATILAPEGRMDLEENQRAVVGADGAPVGPLSPQRDLIANGRFREPLDHGWQVFTDAAISDESPGEVELITGGGQEAVQLFREGTGHAQTGIFQLINQSLNGVQGLQLHLSAVLNHQSLGVCGALGSECPLMVRIDYLDAGGSPRQWVQGFYYLEDPAVPGNPSLCETCPPPRQDHVQHAQGAQFFYDSPNLVEILAQDGAPPASITSISVYASGHSYDVLVTELELLAEE